MVKDNSLDYIIYYGAMPNNLNRSSQLFDLKMLSVEKCPVLKGRSFLKNIYQGAMPINLNKTNRLYQFYNAPDRAVPVLTKVPCPLFKQDQSDAQIDNDSCLIMLISNKIILQSRLYTYIKAPCPLFQYILLVLEDDPYRIGSIISALSLLFKFNDRNNGREVHFDY